MPKRLSLADDSTVWRLVLDGPRVTVENTETTFTIEGDAREGFTAHGPELHARVVAAQRGDVIWVGAAGEVFEFRTVRPGAGRPAAASDHEVLSPPMSATVVRIAVAPGDRVAGGDLLVALEAMKMELPIRAPRDGVVRTVRCREGELVQPGTILVDLDEVPGS